MLTLFCLEPICWCLHGSLLVLTISTELSSETGSFKVKCFSCFVWNWVENSGAWSVISIFQALLHHLVWAHVQICPCFPARGISTESMCFWGGSGENLAHGAVVNEAWEVVVPERSIDVPGRIHQPPKNQNWSLRKAERKSLNAFDTSLVLTVLSSVYFCILASGVSSGAKAVCTRKMAFCRRGQSQEHCVKPALFMF